MATHPELVAGEEIAFAKAANLIIDIKTAGLDRFAADHFMGLLGMAGKEALGGKLYVTSYRLIFVAHKINRLTGEFSIPFHAVTATRRKAKFPVYKLAVDTADATFEFINWHVKAAIAAIERGKRQDTDVLGQFLERALERNEGLVALNTLFLKRRF